METTTTLPHVYPAESAWDEDESVARPRPGYSRVSEPMSDWSASDEANSDLGNNGRDVTDPELASLADFVPTR